jgi:hypothetical protein
MKEMARQAGEIRQEPCRSIPESGEPRGNVSRETLHEHCSAPLADMQKGDAATGPAPAAATASAGDLPETCRRLHCHRHVIPEKAIPPRDRLRSLPIIT